MQELSVVIAFSDIKREFLAKVRTNRSIEDLQLWFTLVDGVLYVHDYEDHEVCMVLALWQDEAKILKVYLPSGSFGDRFIKYLFRTYSQGQLLRKLQDYYDSCGFRPFRFFK